MSEKPKRKIPEPVSEKKSVLYEILRVLALAAFHTVLPVSIIHLEKLKMEPPMILIANHQHALDPVAMAMAFPKEQVVFLGKKELGKTAWLQNLLARVHCILVDRHNTDMEAMRACMKAVKMNKILLIFPEGTRHHEGQMEHIENGTSLIALRSKAPIVPMYIDKPLKLFRRTRIYAGDPIPCADLLEEGINTETCEKMNMRIRETFRHMIRDAEKNLKKNKNFF